MAGDVEAVARFPAMGGDVLRVHENDATAIENAAIAVVETVDSGIELIMAADSGEKKLSRIELDGIDRRNREAGFAGSRFVLVLTRGIRQVKAALLAHFAIQVFAARNDLRDEVADTVIIFNQCKPIHVGARAEGGGREARDDGRLTEKLIGRRIQTALRHVDDPH